jgi:CRISPR-associated protein Csb2
MSRRRTDISHLEIIMCDFVRISVTFLDSRFHGRGDDEAPEWPPSPLRLVQAIVASNFDRIDNDGPLVEALRWLERRPPPRIVAPRCVFGAAYRLSVPNNAMDLVGKAWVAGNYFGTGDLNPASHRAMKTVRPTLMFEGDTVHYLWAMEESVLTCPPKSVPR